MRIARFGGCHYMSVSGDTLEGYFQPEDWYQVTFPDPDPLLDESGLLVYPLSPGPYPPKDHIPLKTTSPPPPWTDRQV